MSFRSPKQLFSKTMHAVALDWPRIISRVDNATKVIPKRSSLTPRCVENWLEGRSKPNADNVVWLMSEFAEVADEILAAAKIDNGLSEVQKRKLREVLGEK